jgi:glycosyltransferase involved in cell wall biosynthesis
VVFTAAHLYYRKGVPLLIDAFARIADRHPDAVLRIVGDGEDREAVTEAAARAGLGDRVQLLGRTQHEQVLQEMAWADLFALVGWDEPHAIAHMEAMASGLPVLCADDGGIMDIFEDGTHGYAVRPHDTEAAAAGLDRLLSDAPGRERMGAQARALVEESHTWDAHALRLMEVFETALGRRAATRAGAPTR